jgi:hypothetical protein
MGVPVDSSCVFLASVSPSWRLWWHCLDCGALCSAQFFCLNRLSCFLLVLLTPQDATTRLQRWWVAHRCRAQFLHLRNCAISIQAVWRGELSRQNQALLHFAAKYGPMCASTALVLVQCKATELVRAQLLTVSTLLRCLFMIAGPFKLCGRAIWVAGTYAAPSTSPSSLQPAYPLPWSSRS